MIQINKQTNSLISTRGFVLAHVAGHTRTSITHLSTMTQCVEHLQSFAVIWSAYLAPTAPSVLLSGLSVALRSFEVFPAPSISFRALANCTYQVTRDAQFMAAHSVRTSPGSACLWYKTARKQHGVGLGVPRTLTMSIS